MVSTFRFVIPLFTAVALVSLATAQERPKKPLTARELFYGLPSVQAAKSEPTKSPSKSTRKSNPSPGKRAPDEVAKAEPKPATDTQPGQAVKTAPDDTLPGGGRVYLAEERSKPPLGLKYKVVKVVSDTPEDVTPDTKFHAGDHIRIEVQTNNPGYLYIVNQGTSGNWKPLFPSPEIANGDNHVVAWQTYTLPPSDLAASGETIRVITFDERTGTENMTIVFSREPVNDFENLIYSLQGPRDKPASSPGEPPKPKQMITTFASLNIDDVTVGRLRKTYSRDLLIEEVKPTPGGNKKETGVYVVNPSGSSDSRLVADLHLVHQ